MTDKNDIERLFKANYGQMYRLAKSLLHDGEAARDIVQDVFASILDSGICPTPSSGYLLSSVRNRCLNHIRDLNTHDRIAHLYFLDIREYDAEEWPDDETIARIYQIIMDDLTPQCRRVMEMRFINGMTFAKIAAELNVSENAVYKHVRHALVIIRQNIRPYGQI